MSTAISSAGGIAEVPAAKLAPPLAGMQHNGGEMRLLLRRYWHRIFVTYGLFNLENGLRLAQPFLLGLAINDLLAASYRGLSMFAVGHVAHLLFRWLRQMYDTRTFSAIYAQRASEIVVRQRTDGVDVSSVAARSTLARQFVDFFEHDVPLVIRSCYSIVGALAILYFYDGILVVYCALLAVPVVTANLVFGRQSLRISRLLNDRLEREVTVVEAASRPDVQSHYRDVARQQIRLSDWQALTTGLLEFFVLALMLTALVRFCSAGNVAAGDIFAVFRYVMLYIMALDAAPVLVQKLSRLKDIGHRIQQGTDDRS